MRSRKAMLLAGAFLTLGTLSVAASPVGTWEIEMGDSRYDVTLCGDGTQLCAELIWLGKGADNAQNLPYLNTLLIDRATPSGPGTWRGALHLFGQSADGVIKQISDTQITLRGCVALVLCRTYEMRRIAP